MTNAGTFVYFQGRNELYTFCVIGWHFDFDTPLLEVAVNVLREGS